MGATIALVVLRGVSAAASLFALAAIVATAATWPFVPVEQRGVLTALAIPAVSMGAILLLGAIGMSWTMPPRRELLRRLPPAPSASTTFRMMIAALAVLTLLVASRLPSAWREGLALVREVVGPGPDPSGLSAFPMAFVLAGLVISALTLLTFLMSTLVGLTVRGELAARAVGAAAWLQAGLVGGDFLLSEEMTQLRVALQRLIAESGDTLAAAQADAWFARYVANETGQGWLVLILLGYVASASVGRAAEPGDDAAEEATLKRRPAPTISLFNESSYSLRPRTSWIKSILSRRHPIYDICSIPARAGQRFSLSWTTGTVRAEPNGPDLLSIVPAALPGTLTNSDYTMRDNATGARVGRVVQQGADWDIRDASDRSVAHVLEQKAGFGRAVHIVTAGEREVCRLTWQIHGATVHQSGLDIEFSDASELPFDRALVMLVAPLVEQKSRLLSRRRVPS